MGEEDKEKPSGDDSEGEDKPEDDKSSEEQN